MLVLRKTCPGLAQVFLSTELKFLKAVGVGEELTARVEIESVRDDKPICKLENHHY
jgi:acyl dehydratase